MKRFVLGITLLLALAPLSVPAAHAEMAIGVKGGLSLSHVNADLFETDNRAGFVGGVYGALGLSPNITVQPELLFVRKGAKLFNTDVRIGPLDLGEFGATLDVDYLEVPVLLRFSMPTAGPVDMRLLAGPVAAFKVGEQLSTTGLIGYRLPTDQVKTTDFGLAVGGAVGVRNGGLEVVAEGRYTFGLTNISDLHILDLPIGGDVKNGAFYATLGVEFPFGAR
jgi:hypothetical protein